MAYTARIYGSETADLSQSTDSDTNIPWWVSYRKGNYKYIKTLLPGETEELYDIDADPEELVNLVDSLKHEPIRKQLKQEMITELRRTQAPFVNDIP